MTAPAVLLVPDGGDRLGWLKVATRHAEAAGMRVDAITSSAATAAALHATGWTVLTSTWQVPLDAFRLVDLDRPPSGDSPDEQRPRRLTRPRWTGGNLA